MPLAQFSCLFTVYPLFPVKSMECYAVNDRSEVTFHGSGMRTGCIFRENIIPAVHRGRFSVRPLLNSGSSSSAGKNVRREEAMKLCGDTPPGE